LLTGIELKFEAAHQKRFKVPLTFLDVEVNIRSWMPDRIVIALRMRGGFIGWGRT
jgi:hypothetical protein